MTTNICFRPLPLTLGFAAGATMLATAVPAYAEEASPRETSGTESRSPLGSLYIDPLGLVLFGPTAGIEAGMRRVSALAYVRWLNAGWLAREMFADEEGESLAFSYGAGLRGRYYVLKPGLAGLYLGFGLEYLRTHVEDSVDLIATIHSLLIPQFDVGYRIAIGKFFAAVSGGLGYALDVSATVENLPGGDRAHLFQPDDVSTVYGSASLEIGIYF